MKFFRALKILEKDLDKHLGIKIPYKSASGLIFTNIMKEFISNVQNKQKDNTKCQKDGIQIDGSIYKDGVQIDHNRGESEPKSCHGCNKVATINCLYSRLHTGNC